MQDAKAGPGMQLAVILGMIWFLNYAAVMWSPWPYPFAYCFGAKLLGPMEEIYRLLFWATILIFVFHLFARKWSGAFLSALAIFLVAGLPTYADVAFRLGASCSALNAPPPLIIMREYY